MKQAAIQDSWRKLSKVVQRANGIKKIEQIHKDRSVFQEIDGVFGIVGANGSGKSSFFGYLTKESYCGIPFLNHQLHFHDGTICNVPGTVVSATILDAQSELRRSNETLIQLKSAFGQEGISVLSADEVGLLNYVLGSNYSSFEVEEVQASGNNIYPRFVAQQGELNLDNESLSLGEQLVLYIYWALTRKYTKPGIYLLEEPEAGLSPAAQLRMIDLLVYISDKNAKQLLLATHSPFMVSRLGSNRLLLMKKLNFSQWVTGEISDYLEELGIPLGCHGVFYVEDNKAKVFLQKLLDIYGSVLRRKFDIIYLGGESNLFEVVSRLSRVEGKIKIIGIPDADQRRDRRYESYKDSFFFLPGSLAPEEELINAVFNYPDEYAKRISAMPSRLIDAMRRCKSMNHHDFFEDLSRDLFNEVKQSVYESAFGVWFSSYPNRQEIHEFMKTIDPLLAQEVLDEVDTAFPQIRIV